MHALTTAQMTERRYVGNYVRRKVMGVRRVAQTLHRADGAPAMDTLSGIETHTVLHPQ